VKPFGYILLVLVAISAANLGWEMFRYRECKKVGHSSIYCVLSGE